MCFQAATLSVRLGGRVRRVFRQPPCPSGSAAVFDVDPFQQTFDTLRPRQCLPADFNLTPGDTLVADCEEAATAAQQPPECAGAPAIASFYNCLTRE